MTDQPRKPGSDSVPPPDANATSAEKRAADDFSGLVESLLAGQRLPPAMDPEQRALVDVAAMIAAGANPVPLSLERQQSVVDDALDRAVRRGKRPASISSLDESRPLDIGGEPPTADVTLPHKTRHGALQIAPWAIAAVAAAAAIMFYISSGSPPAHELRTTAQQAKVESLRAYHRSRPSDPVVGVIVRSEAGDASTRIDAIFASRLDGYRDLRLRPTLLAQGDMQ